MWWIVGLVLLFWGLSTSISTIIFKSDFQRVMTQVSVILALIAACGCFVIGFRKSAQARRRRNPDQ
jgi:hypothetical protein